MRILRMTGVSSGRLIGTISLDDRNLPSFSSPAVRSDFEAIAAARGLTPRAAFDGLAGWSNGHVQIMPEITVARVYDGVRDGVPYFETGHPLVDSADERARLAAYLEAGAPILSTEGLDLDRVEPERGEAVPLSFRTDGSWIWTDTVTYYLRIHRLRPDPALCADIATNGYRCPEVSDAVARHALSELYRSSSEPG